MDKYAQGLLDLLKNVLGDAGSLYLMREVKALGFGPRLIELSVEQRELLLHNICEHVLAGLASPRRVAMLKSQMYRVLEISDEAHDLISSTEGTKWG